MKEPESFKTKDNRSIPALSENVFLRYFNFIALYLAQGIPEGMLLFGIPAWMAMHGKTPGEIGSFVAAVGLPWSFKIIIAPAMDRFTYLPMGRRRPWVLFGQFGLVSSFIAMAFVPDPLNNLNLFMASAFAVGCFGAFQDVATDGMAIDIVPAHQQARANGFMWGSKIIGTSISLAIGSWLIQLYGFKISILSLSILVGLIMMVPLFLRERPEEKFLPWMKGIASIENKNLQLESWSVIFKSLFSVFKLRNSLLLAMLLFFTGGAFNFSTTLLPIFTVKELGWTDVAYSQFYATASLIGGLVGMVFGGILIDKFGKKRMTSIYFFSVVILTVVLVLLKEFWGNKSLISVYMITFKILFVFTSIGLFAIAMQCCWKKVSATQFTLYMTIANLGRLAGAKLIGPITQHLNWEYTILSFVLFISIAWIFLLKLNLVKQEQGIERLEINDLAIV